MRINIINDLPSYHNVCVFQVCDYQLSSLRVHDQGQWVAAGNNLGTSYLVEFSQNLATTQRNDKALLTAVS